MTLYARVLRLSLFYKLPLVLEKAIAILTFGINNNGVNQHNSPFQNEEYCEYKDTHKCGLVINDNGL